jgi:uncharacterized Fe-S cluster protein YjdI
MDLKNLTKKYSNDDITVVWKPGTCIHSAICFHSLPEVFNPGNKPWITISGADTERIIQQVNNCPSGALSYFRNGEEPGKNGE